MEVTIKLAICFLSILAFCCAEDNSALREQCGGTITSDSSSLIFPGNSESTRPGEICMWTILLETTRDFRMNFRHFDSNSTDCEEGGVRIYSLSNLVSSDNIESYEFCASSPAPEDFFLSGTAAVVVLYASLNNTSPGWFGLSWTGNSFDPLKTTHVSSFSTASSGALRYPIVGHYEPNLVATWIVDASPSLDSTRVDFSLESLKLDDCTNPDPCTCDALILYEISQQGKLNESRRFCNDATNINQENIQNKFILAFFTDGESENSTETGFRGIYFPREQPTPTTTTVPTTETPSEDTPCGSIIRGESGVISYKNGTAHGPNERCIWIIEVQDSDMVVFQLLAGNYYNTSLTHGVEVSAFSRNGNMLRKESATFLQEGYSQVLITEIAVVTFYSEGLGQGEGFVLSFNRIITISNRFNGNHVVMSESPSARLDYPETGIYMGNELSAFVYAPQFKSYNGNFEPIAANFTYKGFDDSCDCCDYLDFYGFNYAVGWDYTGGRICNGNSNTTIRFYNNDPLLFIFVSDTNGNEGLGFTLEFRTPTNFE